MLIFPYIPSSGLSTRSSQSSCNCNCNCKPRASVCIFLVYPDISVNLFCAQNKESKSKIPPVMHQSCECSCRRPFVLFTDPSFIVFVHEKRRGRQCPCISSVCVCVCVSAAVVPVWSVVCRHCCVLRQKPRIFFLLNL